MDAHAASRRRVLVIGFGNGEDEMGADRIGRRTFLQGAA
jgi:hypothetical protein